MKSNGAVSEGGGRVEKAKKPTKFGHFGGSDGRTGVRYRSAKGGFIRGRSAQIRKDASTVMQKGSC